MGTNYKDLMLSTDEMKALNSGSAASTKTKSGTIYNTVMVSGPDFAIEKVTPRSYVKFVCLVSIPQIYFENVKTGEKTLYTSQDYVNFTKDMPEEGFAIIDENGAIPYWTTRLYKGKAVGDTLETIFEDNDIRECMKKHYIEIDLSKYQLKRYGYNSPNISPLLELAFDLADDKGKDRMRKMMADHVFSMYNSYCSYRNYSCGGFYDGKYSSLLNELVWSEQNTNLLMGLYGISGVRQIITEFLNTAVLEFPREYALHKLFKINTNTGNVPVRKFDLQKLIQYLFYTSVEEGYALELNGFIDTWSDTLNMQEEIFKNGVFDKYPENLASFHQKLCYKHTLLKQHVDENKWNNTLADNQRFEFTKGEYTIIAPKTPEDMIDEAREQSNCLSSYVQDVLEGNCRIYFLRKTKSPTKSFVTLEILDNGQLGQVKAYKNHAPIPQARKFVEDWYEDVVRPVLLP